jgi:hypothetical protein
MLLGAPESFAKSLPTYSIGGSRQSSARYDGSILQAGVDAAVTEDFRIGASVLTLSREYDGGASISDSSFGLASSYNYDDGVYFEGRAETSPDAEILPKWAFVLTPHKVVGATDFGLGLDYRVYPAVTAGTIHPSVRHEFGSGVAATIGSFITRSDSTLTAYHCDLAVATFKNQMARFSVAGGKSLEDAGVSAGFSSVYAGYTIPLGRFTLGVDANRYWSDLRVETSVGLKLEFK